MCDISLVQLSRVSVSDQQCFWGFCQTETILVQCCLWACVLAMIAVRLANSSIAMGDQNVLMYEVT